MILFTRGEQQKSQLRSSRLGVNDDRFGGTDRSPGRNYHLSSEETVSFLRPWRRREASTRRPLAELMRSRKPCLLTRLRTWGWYVLFISCNFYISKKDCKFKPFVFKSKNFPEYNQILSLSTTNFPSKYGPASQESTSQVLTEPLGSRNLPIRAAISSLIPPPFRQRMSLENFPFTQG